MNYASLPVVKYRNVYAYNIMHRILMTPEYIKAKGNYYPYLIKEGERPDFIASREYDDSSLDWVILLANQIYDVKKDWPLSQADFDIMIEKSYGSLSNALSTISHYTINYNKPSLDSYQHSTLNDSLKKYWRFSPVSGMYDVTSYTLIMNPNQYANIPVAEQSMWIPVSCYDNEHIKNEEKRSIVLIDKDHVSSVKMAAQKIFDGIVDE